MMVAHASYQTFYVAYLVEAGLMPCIIGMWGYYLKMIGLEAVKRYWRYLVARYGGGKYRPFEWTFPDFTAGVYDEDLAKIRQLYLPQLRG